MDSILSTAGYSQNSCLSPVKEENALTLPLEIKFLGNNVLKMQVLTSDKW
jgi:hypothetical protein